MGNLESHKMIVRVDDSAADKIYAEGFNDALKLAQDYQQDLITWIEQEGERTNTCTFNILGVVCKGCKCNRLS